jgi:uncharacterized protein YbaP (TraB family)
MKQVFLHTKWAFIVAAMVFLVACSKDIKTPISMTDLPIALQKSIENPSPSIWEFKGPQGTKVYILGSIHALPKNTRWQTPLLDQIIKEVDQLVLERVPVRSSHEGLKILQYILDYGYSKTEKNSLLGELPGNNLAQARNLWLSSAPDIDGDGVTDAFYRVRPWYYFLITAASPDIPIKGLEVSADLQVTPTEGVEAYLKQALSPSKTKAIVSNFETLSLLAEVGDRVAVDLIKYRLKNIAKTRMQLIDRLSKEIDIRHAWLEGDDVRFWRAYLKRELNTPEAQHEILINRRNAKWLKPIEGYINGNADTLITVGAAHLYGEKGILNQLEARGYQLAKVQGKEISP